MSEKAHVPEKEKSNVGSLLFIINVPSFFISTVDLSLASAKVTIPSLSTSFVDFQTPEIRAFLLFKAITGPSSYFLQLGVITAPNPIVAINANDNSDFFHKNY